MSSDTIDITNVVNEMQDTFITWGISYIYAQIIITPGFGWAALPLVRIFLNAFLEWALTILSSSAVMSAFFLNTAIKKPAQANDFLKAKLDLKNAPSTLSDSDYEKLEQNEMSAFSNFVRISN